MALVDFCGFEAGVSAELYAASGAATWATAAAHDGTYGLKVVGDGSSNNYATMMTFNATTCAFDAAFGLSDPHIGFWFKPYTIQSSGDEFMLGLYDVDLPSKMICELRFNYGSSTTGTIDLYNATGTLLSAGSIVLSSSNWYFVEFRYKNTATKNYTLKINGVQDFSGTPVLTTLNLSHIYLGDFVRRTSSAFEYHYDSIYVDDADFLGECYCAALVPIANGLRTSITSWTGTYADWDDRPHDTDTTRIYTTTSGRYESAYCTKCITAGIKPSYLIHGIKTEYVVKYAIAAQNARYLIVVGGTEEATSLSCALPSSYGFRGRLYTVDPIWGTPWSPAKVDVTEIDIGKVSGSGMSYCTAGYIMVLYKKTGTSMLAHAGI